MFTTLITTIVAAFKAFFDGFENRIYRLEQRLEDVETDGSKSPSALESRVLELESESIDDAISDHIHHNASRICDALIPFMPDADTQVIEQRLDALENEAAQDNEVINQIVRRQLEETMDELQPEISEIIRELDMDELVSHAAEHIQPDYSEIASNIYLGDLASEIDLDDLAGEIDIDELASCAAAGIADQIAEQASRMLDKATSSESVDDLAEIVTAQAQEITDLKERLDAQAHDLRLVVKAAEAFASALRPGDDW